jgi:cytochrome c-type biogenesis protein CcmH/NrfG
MLRTNIVRRFVAVLAVVAAAVAGVPAFAQSTGMVKGVVKDASDSPVEGAKIVIEFSDGMNRKYEVKSSKKGEYIQIGLQPGNYKLTASKDGVGVQFFEGVRIRLGQPTEVNFVLSPAGPGGAPMSKEDAEFRKTFQDGITALNASNWDDALAKFQATVTQRPDCFQCQLAIGEAYMGKADYPNAEAAFNKAKELKPDAPEPYRGLRNLYNNQKNFEKAAEMAAEANKRAGSLSSGGGAASASDLYNQAATFWNAGKYTETAAALEQALQADPNHADSHYLSGMVDVNQGKLPEALAHFEKYVELAPSGTNAAQAKSMVDAIKAQLKK